MIAKVDNFLLTVKLEEPDIRIFLLLMNLLIKNFILFDSHKKYIFFYQFEYVVEGINN